MIEFLNWLDGVLWGLPLIVLMISTGIYFHSPFRILSVQALWLDFKEYRWHDFKQKKPEAGG